MCVEPKIEDMQESSSRRYKRNSARYNVLQKSSRISKTNGTHNETFVGAHIPISPRNPDFGGFANTNGAFLACTDNTFSKLQGYYFTLMCAHPRPVL